MVANQVMQVKQYGARTVHDANKIGSSQRKIRANNRNSLRMRSSEVRASSQKPQPPEVRFSLLVFTPIYFYLNSSVLFSVLVKLLPLYCVFVFAIYGTF